MSEQRVAIWDPDPVFTLGLATTLRNAALTVDNPANHIAWAAGPGTRAMVVSMIGGVDGNQLTALRAAGEALAIVAVVEDDSVEVIQTALAASACSTLPRNSETGEFLIAVLAALNGMSLLRLEALRSLSARVPFERPCSLSSAEADLLRALASGKTVSMLGSQFHCSLRQMHRQMSRLYSKIGVDSRSAAIVKATRWGLISSFTDERSKPRVA